MPCEFHLPDIGEGLYEAEIIQWFIKIGGWVDRDQAIVEIQTDKTTVEISSPVEGVVLALGGEIGQSIEVGKPLVTIEIKQKNESLSHDPMIMDELNGLSANAKVTRSYKRRVIAAPTVLKKARKLAIDITKIEGSEKNGRITETDLTSILSR